MFRRIVGRRGKGGVRRYRCESVSAFVTELRSSREIMSTGRACG
jgi:hypothetical protein